VHVGSRVLAMSGSLREGSYNRALVRALPALAPAGMEFEFFDGLGELPLYNEDLDVEPVPAAVARLRDAVRAADGIVLATPEYLHGLPGVVKNALDWASRPVADPPLCGKGVVVLVATTGRAFGFRALAEATQVFVHLRNTVIPAPEVVVNSAHDVLVTEPDGTVRVADPVAVKLLRIQLNMLADVLSAKSARVVAESLRVYAADMFAQAAAARAAASAG
jgi:chromate reductase